MRRTSDKLEKLCALFERAGSEGERQAAVAAIARLQLKAGARARDLEEEWAWRFPDQGCAAAVSIRVQEVRAEALPVQTAEIHNRDGPDDRCNE